jgi:diguanylate cyclase (GGDEF)-like protein
MLRLKRLFEGQHSPVAMLIVAALAVVLFTRAGGVLLYENTLGLTNSAKWVEHTQEVLSSLDRTSLLTERIEFRTRIYLLTGDEEQLNRARTSVNSLNTAIEHLKVLTSDNPNQSASIRDLSSCAADLNQTLSTFNPHSAVPVSQFQRCQQIVGLMTDREQFLLKERSEGSQQKFTTSVSTELGFVAFSTLTMVILVCFLLRDALRRQRFSKQTMLTNEQLAKTVKALEEQARESALLTSARDELQLCVDVQQVYDAATRNFSQLLPGTSGCLAIINNTRQIVEVVSNWGAMNMQDFSPPESCCGLRSGQPRWRLPGLSEIHCTHFVGGDAPQRYLCKPIVAHGNTLGILHVQCQDEEAVKLVSESAGSVRHMVQITANTVATLNLQTKLESQSIHDSLTGLFNRRFLEVSLEREILRAARRKQVLTVLMLDSDHFKRFNDEFGHAAGDAALKALAEIFRNSIRADDIACRYGGEEFTIILPDVNPELACERAESIRQAVENMRITNGKETYSGFTISIGVAFYPSDGDSADSLLQKADIALYRAKRNGRNQVVMVEEMVNAS